MYNYDLQRGYPPSKTLSVTQRALPGTPVLVHNLRRVSRLTRFLVDIHNCGFSSKVRVSREIGSNETRKWFTASDSIMTYSL